MRAVIAQIERCFCTESKSAPGIIHVRGTKTQVGEEHINRRKAQTGDIAKIRMPAIHVTFACAQAAFGACKVLHIGIETNEGALPSDLFQKRFGMTACAKRHIEHRLALLRSEQGQDFAE